METKSFSKRQFYTERITSTGTVVTAPVDISESETSRSVKFRIACKYVPYDHDPAKEREDPNYYKHFRTVIVGGSSNYSLPKNVLEGLKTGMLVTVIGQLSGRHYIDKNGEDVHEIVILAEELGSNWRFDQWSRDNSRPAEDSPEEETRPRRRRRVTEDSEETESPSAIRRRRASAPATPASEEKEEETARPRPRSRNPRGSEAPTRIINRGDGDEIDEMFQGD